MRGQQSNFSIMLKTYIFLFIQLDNMARLICEKVERIVFRSLLVNSAIPDGIDVPDCTLQYVFDI